MNIFLLSNLIFIHDLIFGTKKVIKKLMKKGLHDQNFNSIDVDSSNFLLCFISDII